MNPSFVMGVIGKIPFLGNLIDFIYPIITDLGKDIGEEFYIRRIFENEIRPLVDEINKTEKGRGDFEPLTCDDFNLTRDTSEATITQDKDRKIVLIPIEDWELKKRRLIPKTRLIIVMMGLQKNTYPDIDEISPEIKTRFILDESSAVLNRIGDNLTSAELMKDIEKRGMGADSLLEEVSQLNALGKLPEVMKEIKKMKKVGLTQKRKEALNILHKYSSKVKRRGRIKKSLKDFVEAKPFMQIQPMLSDEQVVGYLITGDKNILGNTPIYSYINVMKAVYDEPGITFREVRRRATNFGFSVCAMYYAVYTLEKKMDLITIKESRDTTLLYPSNHFKELKTKFSA